VPRLVAHLLALALVASAATAQVAPPQGFVTDRAGVIDPATAAKLTRLLAELQQKTGAEIAVLTVDSTAPLDDFSYALQVAEAWRPGRKRDDTGVLVLVAVKDRKVRVLTGYGVEGILPDGLVGEIQDREMVPEFRAGRMAEGIWRGTAALANRIAAARGVQLTGVPGPRAAAARRQPIPLWVIVLVVVVMMLLASRGGMGSGLRRGRGPVIFPGGFGGGRRENDDGFGGFGGGGGGFGGFGGGGFGGGGAGRSW
jgi:uncharacterized protein